MHQGVTLVMKSTMFGLIAELWGDAPSTQALRGAEGTPEATFLAFDTQENIYRGVIQNLDAVNHLLSKPLAEYSITIEGVEFQFFLYLWNNWISGDTIVFLATVIKGLVFC